MTMPLWIQLITLIIPLVLKHFFGQDEKQKKKIIKKVMEINEAIKKAKATGDTSALDIK